MCSLVRCNQLLGRFVIACVPAADLVLLPGSLMWHQSCQTSHRPIVPQLSNMPAHMQSPQGCRQAVRTAGYTQPLSGHHRRTALTTNCLKCASRQLQQLIQIPNLLVSQAEDSPPCSAERQHQLHQSVASQLQNLPQQQQLLSPGWQPALVTNSTAPLHTDWSDFSANGWAGRQRSQRHPSTPLNAESSRHAAGSTNSSSSSGGPLLDDMPSLPELLSNDSSAYPSGSRYEAPQESQSSTSSRAASSSTNQDTQLLLQQQESRQDSPGVKAAIAMLKWYKDALSPLMASTCRFLPTCSSYSMDSYRAYGVAKGTVLTAWRLLRCNPWGPSGYDPTTWPPPGLEWMFRFQGSAEVAVVVGAAVLVRFTHALLFE